MTTDISSKRLKPQANTDSAIQQKSYHFTSALRPFSLFIALATTGIVCTRVREQPEFSSMLAILVIVGTVLAQAAVNLFNDWSEREAHPKHSDNYKNIKHNFYFACAGFCIAASIGLYIALIRGAPVIWLAFAGFFACLAYTLEPFNLKRRGLGLPAVFVIMGPVLMLGSGYAMTGAWHTGVMLDAIIFGPLISLVLLANELRDYEYDQSTIDKTFTVRVGYRIAKNVFVMLTSFTIIAYGLAIAVDHIHPSPVFFIPLVLALWIIRFLVAANSEALKKLPPMCGRLVLATGAAHIIALLEI